MASTQASAIIIIIVVVYFKVVVAIVEQVNAHEQVEYTSQVARCARTDLLLLLLLLSNSNFHDAAAIEDQTVASLNHYYPFRSIEGFSVWLAPHSEQWRRTWHSLKLLVSKY